MPTKLRPLLLPLFAATLAFGLCVGCSSSEKEDRPARKPKEERIAWWRDARFGLFIHWGLYAIPAGEWDGRTDHAEWIRTTAQIPLERYEELQGRFNPVRFDAGAWVRAAKDAGMRYIVITSKHHDGFCLWDSAETDWDVMGTPFQRDILAELAEACEDEGLRLCFYHSIMDWHHPDYLPRREWENDRPVEGADYARFVAYVNTQVGELLTKYGPIGVMWFDGEWEPTWNHAYGQALYEHCLDLAPDVIVNNRVDKGRGGMAGMTVDAKFAGDFGTPEQEIPATGFPGVDWETCMTMNDHWGWNQADQAWKPTEQLIRMLVDIASKGGNFLLNVGPTAEGEFPPEALERLAGIGRWMERYGETIHGSQASPFEELSFGRCTAKPVAGKSGRWTLYLQVFEWPANGELLAPGLGNQPARAFVVGDEETELEVVRRGTDVMVRLPAAAPDPVCTPVALEIEGAPIVYEAPRISAESDQFVTGLDVRVGVRSPALVVRYTLDGSEPTFRSPASTGVVRIGQSCELRARSFHDNKPVSPVVAQSFEKVMPPLAPRTGALSPGLALEVFAGEWDSLPDFGALEAESRDTSKTVELGDAAERERCGLRFSGFVSVPKDEVYIFALESDDGARLWIGDTLVVDNDGLHGALELSGTIVLARGAHPIRVEWFNKTGSASLALRWAVLGQPLRTDPGAFTH